MSERFVFTVHYDEATLRNAVKAYVFRSVVGAHVPAAALMAAVRSKVTVKPF